MVYELIDDETFLIKESSEDIKYGYNPDNPIPIFGSSMEERLHNKRRYLNALLSPTGRGIIYRRIGSFLPFEAEIEGIECGFIDVYQVYWDNMNEHIQLYLNMYSPIPFPLKAPLGLSMKG